jgi:hypothetical protein
VPSIGDRRDVAAEPRGGESYSGASGDRVGLDCLSASPFEAADEESAATPAGRSSVMTAGYRRDEDGGATASPWDEAGEGSGAARDEPFVAESSAPPRGKGGRKPARQPDPEARAVPYFILWAVLILDLQALLWLSGVKALELKQAVEQGVARAESRAVGELGDSQIHKVIQDQRATLGFWTTLAILEDFVAAPASPIVRALAVATILGALAALFGRPIGFRAALGECAAVQGCWVLGLAMQAALVFGRRTSDIDVSMTLFLPPGTYRAFVWVALRQLDAFAILGWLALIYGGWRRRQANLLVSTMACSLVAAGELALRILWAVVTGVAMRLALTSGRF